MNETKISFGLRYEARDVFYLFSAENLTPDIAVCINSNACSWYMILILNQQPGILFRVIFANSFARLVAILYNIHKK